MADQSSADGGPQGTAALREGEAIPTVGAAGGHYLPMSLMGTTCFFSGYISREPDGRWISGKVTDASVGAEAARTCALGHLSLIEHACGGVDNIRRVHKATVFVNGPAGFPDSPAVANGYSDLMTQYLGARRGAHARSAVTVAGLPFDASVEVEAIVEVVDPAKCADPLAPGPPGPGAPP